ncbi:unnamed protein product [Allacma fusca]|uniref:Uncharacterized protein n=1 Tax=Allacma fusca TaxID=39272 RepID=A0A8J2PM41_9HEXA|nr:unnamed protein product [Allacma fusca]
MEEILSRLTIPVVICNTYGEDYMSIYVYKELWNASLDPFTLPSCFSSGFAYFYGNFPKTDSVYFRPLFRESSEKTSFLSMGKVNRSLN